MIRLFATVATLAVVMVGCGAKENGRSEAVKEQVAADQPSCEESLRAASKKVPELTQPNELSEAVADCIKAQWPVDMRRCVATVRDRPDLVACGLRYEEQRKANEDTTLQVTEIDPNKGGVEGGTYVRIKGNRFIADGARNAKVYFGSRQGTVVRFASDSELIVEAPGGKNGEVVDVLVIFEPGGELKLPTAFTFIEKPL